MFLSNNKTKKMMVILGSICFFATISGQTLLTDWKISVTISSGTDGGYGKVPQVGIDNTGNAVAIWNIQNQIQVSQFNASTEKWTIPQLLAAGGVSTDFSLVVNPTTGYAVAAWAGPNGVYASQYNGIQWSVAPKEITTNHADLVKMAIDTSGNITIGWRDISSTPYSLKTTRYNTGSSWPTWQPTIQDIGTIGTSDNYHIVMDGFGDTLFVWIQTITGNSKIQARWYDTVSWQNIRDITGIVQIASLNTTINPTGNSVIAWTEGAWGSQDAKTTYYNHMSSWNSWTFNNITMPKIKSDAFEPDVAIDNDSNIFITWGELDTITLQTILRATRCEVPWDSWTPLAKTIAEDIGISVVIKMDSFGNVFLATVYVNPTPPDLAIIAIRYDGTPWAEWDPTGKIENLSEIDDAEPIYLKLATDGQGNACVIWTKYSGGSFIEGSFYDASGTLEGGPWIPLRDISNTSISIPDSQVAMNNNGSIIIVWDAKLYDSLTLWRILSSWNIALANKDLRRAQPTDALYISATADGEGNAYIATVQKDEIGDTRAILSRNQGDAPIDQWTTDPISLPTQSNVTEVNIQANANDKIVSGYIDEPLGQGEVWIKNDNLDPQKVSASEHNASNHKTAIVPYSVSEGQRGVVYVNKNEISQGEICISLFNEILQDWTNSMTLSTTEAESPRIEFDASGNVFVVWKALDNEKWRIQARRAELLANLLGWDIQDLQNLSDEAFDSDMPQLAADSTGCAIFVWKLIDSNGTSTFGQIQAVRYKGPFAQDWDTWNPLSEIVPLSDADKDATDPRIDMDSAGNAIVIWKIMDDNDTWKLQAARFDAQTKTWSLPVFTKSKSSYLSDEDVALSDVSVSEQGYAIVAYSLTDSEKVLFNIYNPNTKLFSDPMDTGFSFEQVNELTTIIDYHDRVGVVSKGVRRVTRSDNNESIEVALLKNTQYPQPPVNAQLRQKLHRFPTQADLINVLSWQAGDNTAVRYELYADADRNNLIATISAHQPLCFMHHCRRPGISETYYLFAINAAGNYSDPVIIH